MFMRSAAMRTKFFLVVSTFLLCSACSVSVAPIATPTGVINPEEKSLTETHEDVSFTVKLDQLSVAPYQHVDNIASFHVDINNQTTSQVSFPSRAFLLKDGNGRQYRSILPEKVREIVSKDSVYLIPYPYVGYYYLEDQARFASDNTFASSLPFYAEYHPQDIFTNALTEEPILKSSSASGVVYFITNLEQSNYVELLVFPNQEATGEPLLKFPFAIEK
jgi:hypothetical protein